MMVGFNFSPRGWAKCDGQLLPISSNSAVFSLLGTTFGGDGRTTFGLPDLRGRVAKHIGNGPGLANVTWGQKGGRETVTLTNTQLPSHTHTMISDLKVKCNGGGGGEDNPEGNFPGVSPDDMYADAGTADMAAGSVDGTITAQDTGNGQAFNIDNPYLGILHNIALVGIFPSRN